MMFLCATNDLALSSLLVQAPEVVSHLRITIRPGSSLAPDPTYTTKPAPAQRLLTATFSSGYTSAADGPSRIAPPAPYVTKNVLMVAVHKTKLV